MRGLNQSITKDEFLYWFTLVRALRLPFIRSRITLPARLTLLLSGLISWNDTLLGKLSLWALIVIKASLLHVTDTVLHDQLRGNVILLFIDASYKGCTSNLVLQCAVVLQEFGIVIWDFCVQFTSFVVRCWDFVDEFSSCRSLVCTGRDQEFRNSMFSHGYSNGCAHCLRIRV